MSTQNNMIPFTATITYTVNTEMPAGTSAEQATEVVMAAIDFEVQQRMQKKRVLTVWEEDGKHRTLQDSDIVMGDDGLGVEAAVKFCSPKKRQSVPVRCCG